MRYDIYFHDDFDGAASAAIMLSFFESRGDTIGRLMPVNFRIKSPWHKTKFKNPAVVLDYPYHPKVTFWYDHHSTTFLKPEWRKKFRSSKFRKLDPGYDSCCALVLDALRDGFEFKPSAHFRELVRWGDIIDKANYKSPRQTIDMKEAAIALSVFIDENSHKRGFFNWLVPLLATRSLGEIARTHRFIDGIKRIRSQRHKVLSFYRKNLRIEGRTSYIDFSRTNLQKMRMAPYYFSPNLLYSVTLKKDGPFFHLNAGANPWRRKENILHIGNILGKYGGGGHKDVGGVEIRSREAAEKIAREIIELLKKKSA